MREKILNRIELAQRLGTLRAQAGTPIKVVFTNGCFDLMHVGHLRYLWEARKQGDLLVVALNDDESVRRLKGPQRPILNQNDRLMVMAGLACVDYVTTFHEETPVELLQELEPDVLVKGANYSIDGVVGRELIEARGGEVKTLRLTEGRSTTNIVERILATRSAGQ